MTQHFYSISYHYAPEIKKQWENWKTSHFIPMIENLMDITQYYFSEVQTDFTQDGHTESLLLGFESQDLLQGFIDNELLILEEALQKNFGENVLFMKSQLNVLQKNSYH